MIIIIKWGKNSFFVRASTPQHKQGAVGKPQYSQGSWVLEAQKSMLKEFGFEAGGWSTCFTSLTLITEAFWDAGGLLGFREQNLCSHKTVWVSLRLSWKTARSLSQNYCTASHQGRQHFEGHGFQKDPVHCRIQHHPPPLHTVVFTTDCWHFPRKPKKDLGPWVQIILHGTIWHIEANAPMQPLRSQALKLYSCCRNLD